MPSKKLSLRDHVDGSRLDLSMSDLDEVPVREIAQTKKVTELDLSNNRLTTLGKNFPTLTQIVKLDLSKNHLVELPEDFGNLILLRHLDLYSNQLTHLPLSFCQLKSLKWLDLKNNPLVPRLAEVVGPCLDAQQCQRSAKVVVPFLQEMKDQIEAKIIKRQEQKKLEKQEAAMQEKPREQKKKKKGAKQNDKNQNKPSTGSKDKAKAKKSSEKALNHNLLEENSLATDVKNAGSSFWKKLIIFLMMCISSLSVCIFFMQEENSSLQHILNGAYNNFNEWYIFITKSEIGVISTIACAAASMVQFIKLVILYSFTKIEEVYQHMQNENITVEVKSSLNGLWQILCQKTKDVYVSFKEEFPSGGS